MLNNIINDLKNLEGKEIGKGSYFHKIYTNEASYNKISTIKVLENLEGYEMNNFTSYNYETDEFIEVDAEEFLELECYREIKSDNTFNWNAPLTNHINFTIYSSAIDDNIIVELSVHRFGDVRTNYSDYAYFQFDDEYEFYQTLSEGNSNFTITKDGIEYDITIDILSDCPMIIINNEEYIEGYEADELLEELFK